MFEEIMTIIQGVDGVLNTRSLSYIQATPTEQEPLTPEHILMGRRMVSMPTERTAVTQRSTRQNVTIQWLHQR